MDFLLINRVSFVCILRFCQFKVKNEGGEALPAGHVDVAAVAVEYGLDYI